MQVTKINNETQKEMMADISIWWLYTPTYGLYMFISNTKGMGVCTGSEWHRGQFLHHLCWSLAAGPQSTAGNVLATLGRAPQMAANWDTNNPRKMKDREFHWVKQAHLVISEETWVTLYVLLASRIFAAGFFHWWLVLHCHLVDYRGGFGRIQGMTMTRGFMGCKTSNSG